MVACVRRFPPVRGILPPHWRPRSAVRGERERAHWVARAVNPANAEPGPVGLSLGCDTNDRHVALPDGQRTPRPGWCRHWQAGAGRLTADCSRVKPSARCWRRAGPGSGHPDPPGCSVYRGRKRLHDDPLPSMARIVTAGEQGKGSVLTRHSKSPMMTTPMRC